MNPLINGFFIANVKPHKQLGCKSKEVNLHTAEGAFVTTTTDKRRHDDVEIPKLNDDISTRFVVSSRDLLMVRACKR